LQSSADRKTFCKTGLTLPVFIPFDLQAPSERFAHFVMRSEFMLGFKLHPVIGGYGWALHHLPETIEMP
jgi:hypothetical protein